MKVGELLKVADGYTEIEFMNHKGCSASVYYPFILDDWVEHADVASFDSYGNTLRIKLSSSDFSAEWRPLGTIYQDGIGHVHLAGGVFVERRRHED